MQPIDTPLTRSWTSSFMPGRPAPRLRRLPHRLEQLVGLGAGLRLDDHHLVHALAALVERERGADALVVLGRRDRVADRLRLAAPPPQAPPPAGDARGGG